MSDERYERSADMRLLEMQREALGKPPRVFGTTHYTDPDLPADADADDEPVAPRGTVVMASLDAQPRAGLIPGALVGVSIAIGNDGGSAAHGVHLTLPMPVGTAYRAGTFAIDGAAEADALAADVFGGGIELGDIDPGARRTVLFKLAVETGLGDIVLAPHVRSASGAVLGPRALRLRRGAAPAVAPRVEPMRPFYELDDDEEAAEASATPAGRGSFTVVQPPELPPAPAARKPLRAAPVKPNADAKAKPKAEPKPRVKAKAKVKNATVAAPAPPPAAAPAPRPPRAAEEVAIAAAGGPILTVAIDRKRLATLGGLFAGPSFGMVAHYLVLNALAATDPLPGDTGDRSLAAFVRRQEHLLSRALIAIRLGKTPAPESITAPLPAFPPPLSAHRAPVAFTTPAGTTDVLLVRAFGANEIDFLARMVSGGTGATFLQAAQLFVGLCANGALGGDATAGRRVRESLAVYAALANAEISRIYLRSKLSRKSLLFRETDAAFDDAARGVLAALADLAG